jgi:catechol 2,3-dioxygenase-like lactoylglutathione lyase family enzyme
MSKTVGGTRIVEVEGVAVPVRDQDRALRFYVDRLDFEIRRDVPMADGGRWIQVAPPAATTTVALVAAGDRAPVGLDTGISFTTSDAEAAHADLRGRGVDVDELLRWPGVPAMFAFRDEDGNGLKMIGTS